MQLQRRRLSFHQVRFEALGEALVIKTAFFCRHAVPPGFVQSEPSKDGAGVVEEAPLSGGKFASFGGFLEQPAAQLELLFEKEMPQFVLEGRAIRALEQGKRARGRGKRPARGTLRESFSTFLTGGLFGGNFAVCPYHVLDVKSGGDGLRKHPSNIVR